MFLRFRVCLAVALFAGAGLLLNPLPIAAQDKENPKQATDKPADKDKPAKDNPADTPEEPVDPFAVPKDADVETLVKFITDLRKFRPSSQQEYLTFLRRGPKAFATAADRILELEKDKESLAYRLATMIKLQTRILGIGRLEPAERKQVIEDVQKHIADQKKVGADEVRLAMELAQNLERGRDSEIAVMAYKKLGKLLAASDDAEITKIGRMMEGASRRLGLIGKPLELKGTTFAGKTFDLENLRGKIVLVDFWATWCGPCLREHPNILRNYETYKDRGFEVVGVSIDQNRQRLEQYLATKDVPWTTLHEQEQDGQHPALTHYGIFGIPAMFLVDKDGNVLSTQARGRELDNLLRKHLGPPGDTEDGTK